MRNRKFVMSLSQIRHGFARCAATHCDCFVCYFSTASTEQARMKLASVGSVLALFDFSPYEKK